ncbi:hypothetical protein K8R33_03975 [archaeon]|nr:hypothetical protein [archaeon]
MEIFAAILAIAILLKAIVFLFKPNSWKGFADSIINMNGYKWISLILAVVLFYFVMQFMSIVHFMAAWLVIAFFYQSVMFNYKKSMRSMIKEAWKPKGEMWIYFIIAVALGIWTLLTIF